MIGLKALDIPQKFILPIGDQFLEDDDKVVPGNIWEVYSDRTYNKTTDKPGGSRVFKVIQYLDKFYIVETKKKFLHLVKDPNINTDGTFSEQSEDYGWISSENILLWRHCLVDDNGRNKRVFIFRNEETENYFTSIGNDLQNTPKYFQVLYVLKEEKDRSLLAKTVRIYGGHAELNEKILGWVTNDRFAYFSSNVFTEPDPLIDQSSDSELTDIVYPVFFDKRSVKKSSSTGEINPSKTLWNTTKVQELEPTNYRLPIHSIDDKIATVLVYYPDVSYQIGNFNNELEAINKFYKGYCNISVKSKNLSFRKVLLLSKNELANLLEESDLLLRLSDGAYDSITIANQFRNVFQIDQNHTDSMILSTLLSSLYHKKYGCFASNTFNEHTIRELFLMEKESSNKYFNTIKENLRSLNSIYNNNLSDNFFLSNGIQYYWIPCDYLP